MPKVGKVEAARSWRFLLGYVVPTLLILLWVVLPLVRGTHTFYLRDVLNAHLEKKWVQAEAMAEGYMPLVDPYRDGGQPFLGNPNSVALYPDNILLLVASPLWMLNAHFWLHLLFAPFSAYWLARSWGLRREASWAAGVFFVANGFFFSMLNLYNMVAGVALAPALIAATIELSQGAKRASRLAAVALLWCLLLLSGDPMTAAMALVLAISAAATRWGLKGVSWRWSFAGVGLGFVLALPQLVEFIRVLPMTFRGYWGFSVEGATIGSWHPASALELLIPFALGMPDLTFWGQEFHGGHRPLILTLYPGVIALWLLFSSGRPRSRLSWWSWSLVWLGLFFVLGSFNPLVALLWELPGASLLRLPIKFWLLVAIGGSLLGAVGFQRLLDRETRRPSPVILLGLGGLVFFVGWLFLNLASGPIDAWLRGLIPAAFPDEMVDGERVRWAGLCLLSLVALAAVAMALRLARRWPVVLGPAVLLIHLVFQLVVLRPAIAIDEVAPYLEPPELLAVIPEGSVVMYGKGAGGFDAGDVPLGQYPDHRGLWLQRQVFRELYPVAGIMAGRRYAFSVSPEGLDSFLTRVAGQALEAVDDLGRVRLLAASGVEYLILGRPLASGAIDEAELVARSPTLGGELFVYRLLRTAPEVSMVGGIFRAPHLNAAVSIMVSNEFDPRTETVLPEGGPALAGPPGSVDVVAATPEALKVDVEASVPGALVVQRAFLPLYRATVDGEEASLVAANVHRLGLEIPQGTHAVEIWVDRRPFRISTALALIGVVLLLGLVWRLALQGRADAADSVSPIAH